MRTTCAWFCHRRLTTPPSDSSVKNVFKHLAWLTKKKNCQRKRNFHGASNPLSSLEQIEPFSILDSQRPGWRFASTESIAKCPWPRRTFNLDDAGWLVWIKISSPPGSFIQEKLRSTGFKYVHGFNHVLTLMMVMRRRMMRRRRRRIFTVRQKRGFS